MPLKSRKSTTKTVTKKVTKKKVAKKKGDFKEQVCALIKQERGERSLAEASDLSGINQSTIWRIEEGISEPSLRVFIKLLSVYETEDLASVLKDLGGCLHV